MTLALLLFDIDGCTAVVPTAKLSQEARASVHCEASVSGKKFKVEVLAVADDMQTLNKFEENWSLSHRAKHLTRVKEEIGHQRKGGFLSKWPEDPDSFECAGTGPAINLPTKPHAMESMQKQCNGQNSKKLNAKIESTLRARKVMIRTVLPETQSASLPKMPQSRKSLQSLERLKVQVAKMRKTSQVGAPAQKRSRLPIKKQVGASAQKSSRLPIKKQIGAPAQKHSRLPIKKQVGVPAQKRSRLPIKKQTSRKTSESIPMRRNLTENSVGEAVNNRPFSSEIKGTNGRQIKVLHEGTGDYTGSAVPQRQPQFYDGLSADQVDLLEVRISEFRNGKVSMSTQTDHVIIISSDEEMLALRNSDRPKMVDKSTDTSEINKDEISCKLEKVIQLLENPTKGSNGGIVEKPQQSVEDEKFMGEAEKICRKSIDFSNGDMKKQECEEAFPDFEEQTDLKDNVSSNEHIPDTVIQECGSATPKHEPVKVDELENISSERHSIQSEMNITKPVIIRSPTVVMTELESSDNSIVSQRCDFAAEPANIIQNPMASETYLTSYNYLTGPSLPLNSTINTPAPRYSVLGLQAINNSLSQATDTSGYKECSTYGTLQQKTSSSVSSPTIQTDEIVSQTCSLPSLEDKQCMETSLPVVSFAPDNLFKQASITMEIRSADDIVSVPINANVRIATSTIREVYASSGNFGNFAWNLTKRLYKKEERFGKCFNARSSSKVPISPRRKCAINKALEEVLEGHETKAALLKIANDAIVTGLRNESRQRVPLKEMTLNLNLTKLQ